MALRRHWRLAGQWILGGLGGGRGRGGSQGNFGGGAGVGAGAYRIVLNVDGQESSQNFRVERDPNSPLALGNDRSGGVPEEFDAEWVFQPENEEEEEREKSGLGREIYEQID